MKSVLRRIDRAIKRLYNLDFSRPVEHFLVSLPGSRKDGALLLAQPDRNSLELGIHLSDTVRDSLRQFPAGQWVSWSGESLQAFTVATEEVSHFHYLRHHATHGRQVTQLELELQGEIDKFLIAYFTNPSPDSSAQFVELFERFFSQFRLQPGLSHEQQERYLEANRLARRYIHKLGAILRKPEAHEELLRRLRKFYRLNATEKISFIAA